MSENPLILNIRKNSEPYIPDNLERTIFLIKIGIHWIMVTVIAIAV